MTDSTAIKGKRFQNQIAAIFTLENLALLSYAVFIGMYFFNTTTFYVAWERNAWNYIRIVLYIIIFARAVSERRFTKFKVVLYALAMGGLLLSQMRNGYQIVADVLIVALALQGIPFDRIVKVFFITISTLLFITVIAALTGSINNLVFSHAADRRRRIAFGIIYPTDFAAYVFFLWLAWCYIRKNLITWIEIALVCVTSGLLWYFCDTRLDCICLIGLAVALAILKIRWALVKNGRRTADLPRWVYLTGILAMPVLAIFYTGLTYFYNPNNPLLAKIDKILSSRLLKGELAFRQFGINFLGRPIQMSGNGGTSLYYMRSETYFIDSSYLYTLFRYGLVVLGVVLLTYVFVMIRVAKKQDAILAAIMILISLQCMIEHHLLEPNMNPFLLAAVASFTVRPDCNEDKKTDPLLEDGIGAARKPQISKRVVFTLLLSFLLVSIALFSKMRTTVSTAYYDYGYVNTTKYGYPKRSDGYVGEYRQYFHAVRRGNGLSVDLTTFGKMPRENVTLKLYDAESEALVAEKTISAEEIIGAATSKWNFPVPPALLVSSVEKGVFEFSFEKNCIEEGKQYYFAMVEEPGKNSTYGYILGSASEPFLEKLVKEDDSTRKQAVLFRVLYNNVPGAFVIWTFLCVVWLLLLYWQFEKRKLAQ